MVTRCRRCRGGDVQVDGFRLDPAPSDPEDAHALTPPESTTFWFRCPNCQYQWEETLAPAVRDPAR
jgi:hypothetical protein